MKSLDLVLVVHNVRSCHNVGSIMRTADGLGISQVYLTGYTPYPQAPKDSRLPHEIKRVSAQIHKTALGAEMTQRWSHVQKTRELLQNLSDNGFQTVALEQTPTAIVLKDFKPSGKVALIVGSEVGGIEEKILELADAHVEIPMRGSKESLNVSIAAAIALFHLSHIK